MPVRTEKDLAEPARNLWFKAISAVELRNFGYAISLLRSLLRQEPEFLMGRRLLRRAEISNQKTQKRRFLTFPISLVQLFKAERELKKDPKIAVEMVERILERDPFNHQANLLLKQAALAAGWPEVAAYALQTLLEANPRDTKILHELGRLYHEQGDSQKEVETYEKIVEIDPHDAEAKRLCQEASAHASMKSGGWMRAKDSDQSPPR